MAGAVALSVSPVFAASDNGCDDSNNDYIQSDYALCSTHPYNVGMVTIPDANGRAVMREVVAMKAELITQQMYQNYRALESMVNRLEKQLTKVTIKAQTEAASSGKSPYLDDDRDGGRGYNPGNRGTPLATANDCSMKTSNSEIISCLQSNIQIIRNEINSGNTVNARKQLQNDLSIAQMNGFIKKDLIVPDGEDKTKTLPGYYSIKITNFRECISDAGNAMTNCNNISTNTKRQTYLNCLNEFNAALSPAREMEDCKHAAMSGGGRY